MPRVFESQHLAPIQAGTGSPRLVCVHPAGGTVFCYHGLARQLPREVPFFGIQAGDDESAGVPSGSSLKETARALCRRDVSAAQTFGGEIQRRRRFPDGHGAAESERSAGSTKLCRLKGERRMDKIGTDRRCAGNLEILIAGAENGDGEVRLDPRAVGERPVEGGVKFGFPGKAFWYPGVVHGEQRAERCPAEIQGEVGIIAGREVHRAPRLDVGLGDL